MATIALYVFSFLTGISLAIFAAVVALHAIAPMLSAKPFLLYFGGGLLAGLVILAAVAVYVHNHSF